MSKKERALADHADIAKAVELLEGVLERARESRYASVQACCELAIERANDVLAWTKILAEDYLEAPGRGGKE